jgi:hypothetical protein
MLPPQKNLSLKLIQTLTLWSASALCAGSLLSSSNALAELVQTRIFRVEAPATAAGMHEVLSTHDGRVYSVAPTDRALLGKLQGIARRGAPAELVLDGERVIDGNELPQAAANRYSDYFDSAAVAEEARDSLAKDDGENLMTFADNAVTPSTAVDPSPMSLQAARALGYEPTILASMDQAQSLFRTERELKHHS